MVYTTRQNFSLVLNSKGVYTLLSFFTCKNPEDVVSFKYEFNQRHTAIVRNHLVETTAARQVRGAQLPACLCFVKSSLLCSKSPFGALFSCGYSAM